MAVITASVYSGGDMKAFVGCMNLLVNHNHISRRVPQQPVDRDRGGGVVGLVINTGNNSVPHSQL